MEKFSEKMVFASQPPTEYWFSVEQYGTNVNLYKQKLLDVCANTRK